MIYGRKPIMSPALETSLLNAVVMFTKQNKWKQWGLHYIRKQGSAFLLEGPPGCGKTTIANWLSLRIRKKGLKEVSFADFGSGDPGQNARNIRSIFEDAKDHSLMTVYLDECDAVLVNRDNLGPDAQWMMEVINELLQQIDKYPGLVILSTNRVHALDPALFRRLLAIIHVPPPEFDERVKLWNNKIPDSHPLRLTPSEVKELATLQLTGAEIENSILNYSGDIIRRDGKPTYKGLFDTAKKLYIKKRNLYSETSHS